MYCPKCRDIFEEGSRRFCPTDGARLISDAVEAQSGTGHPGIFSNLLPKVSHDTTHDEVLSNAPKVFTTEPELDLFSDNSAKVQASEPYFEIGDVQPEIENVANFSMPTPAAETPEPEVKNLGRKVNPYDIPAGHVELESGERAAGTFSEFDADNPESFVGRMVKGRYRVTEFLGGDGSGLGYLADDNLIADKMVLVRILVEDGSDQIMNSILAEERVSLSHFSHPNIGRLIDSGEFTDGTQFLVTEYTDALSVSDILGIHGQIELSRAARVIRQASHALNEAHQEGIIHRDIRPENLIICPDGETEQTKLINFGASNGEPNPLNAGYKAPEVLDGRVATVSSDIFSLAVVAYEMLTGNMPFDGSTAKEIVRMQSAGLTEPPSTVRRELPYMVDDVLSKALAFNAADRFAKARDFGDAFSNALVEPPRPIVVSESSIIIEEAAGIHEPEQIVAKGTVPTPVEGKVEILKPIAAPPVAKPAEPAWKNRSPEPPQVETSRAKIFAGAGILVLLVALAFGWYYLFNHPAETGLPTQSERNDAQNNIDPNARPVSTDIEVPPLPRKIAQPPNTDYYDNNKANLKGDLSRNFVGFSVYYPKDWKVNGPQESTTLNTRGKFLDIARVTPEGQLKEQMLISYYQSKGTFKDDKEKFALMVRETNDTLKKLLPGYQMVSEGEIAVNGGWRAYEVKFQAGGTSVKGEKLIVWGRRLFIPAARPGTRAGFEITMLATSLADEVRSVDDVGVHGELSAILASFEPSQNF